MGRAGTAALLLSGVVFSVFIANVVVAATGAPAFLSDVVEMLTLFLACILFVVAILWRERSEKPASDPIDG